MSSSDLTIARQGADHGKMASRELDVEPYSYDEPMSHLTGSEALDLYRRALSHSDALIVIEDKSCGHWSIKEYATPEAKAQYLRITLDKCLTQALRLFTGK